jgi:hypothetical protein
MTTQTQNKHIHILNIHVLYGIRTHDPGFQVSEDSSCHRPPGHRDQQSLIDPLLKETEQRNCVKINIFWYLTSSTRLLATCLYVTCPTLRPWWWKKYVSPKRYWTFTELHRITYKRIVKVKPSLYQAVKALGLWDVECPTLSRQSAQRWR